MTDPEGVRRSKDPYFYARSRGPNLYDEREFVFDHIDPAAFIEPALRAAGITPEQISASSQEVILYSTQLAIGTHRPNFVRDLEEAAFEEACRQDRERREQQLREKYGDSLDDSVTMGGLKWPIDLADSFAEQMAWFESLPVSASGTRMLQVDENTFSTLQGLIDNPEPYHPHHGYRLSIEHEHLAAACAGRKSGIKVWDRGMQPKPGSYEERYRAFFSPDFFVDLALRQLMIDPTVFDEVSRRVASGAVQGVLDQFGGETRDRHAAGDFEFPEEEADDTEIVRLDLKEIQAETDRQTDFENLWPGDII